MPFRLFKKCLGNYYSTLMYGASLKPGDLISTCKGYNERVKEVRPRWTKYGNCHRLRRGSYVFDFDIETEGGSSCSLFHCCTYPLETKEQIVKYFLEWDNAREYYPDMPMLLTDALKAGKDVFDEDGQPFYEYCNEWEQKTRFPERFANETKA